MSAKEKKGSFDLVGAISSMFGLSGGWEKHYQMGVMPYEEGEYDAAEKHWTKAVELASRGGLSSKIDLLLNGVSDLARTRLQNGDAERALSLYQSILPIELKLTGKDNRYASTLRGLATAYMNLDKYSQAEPLYKDALDIYKPKAQSNPSDTDYIDAMIDLAICYEKQGQPTQAEPIYKQLLASHINEQLLPKEQAASASLTALAVVLANYAVFLETAGRGPDADVMYKRLLAISEIAPWHMDSNDILKGTFAFLKFKRGEKAQPEKIEHCLAALQALRKAVG